ncbi:hypothetical protein GCM10010503_55970 [Streptomyces lucensis JCM 4490]|uniref:Integral membrane protein n=1 Tax=Streptomyces lucensis JCM 4490 TaxID=1306176 RepID=A0A918JCF4_9ACTN|nr:hypothetical protein [Streptomyces lucensis]GGW71349.1 hypothetical protein GCM10010503_55970 [Streptomyces lucensis JCM 4490]
MAGSAHATLAGLRRERRPRDPAARVRGPWATAPLAAVAAAYALAQLLLVRPGMGLGWDETVYVSQVSGHAPAAFFSAPRARGVSLLVAPIASWSSSTALLRTYLAVLSGLALYVSLRAWRRLFPVRVLALAGALFASLWVTLFYGPQAMPNLWVALGALTAVACFLRARDRGDRAALWGLAASATLMAWMRPTDAVWVTLPLLALGLVRRHWRALCVLLAGLAAGAAEWVIEAYVSYGGLGRRLSAGSDIQGGLGWHFAVPDQLRSLGGRALCRPCTGALPHPLITLWWFVLPPLAVLGLAVAVRARRRAATTLALACAATAAFPYLFLIGYAAPRFLLPAYALLALPVAAALLHLATAPRGPWRRAALALVCVGLAGHLAVQLAVLARTVDGATASHRDWSRTADRLHRLGVRPPCLLTGRQAIPIAFYTGCASAATSGHNANSSVAVIARTARRMPVAVLVPEGSRPPAYARHWPVSRFDDVLLYHAVPPARSTRAGSRTPAAAPDPAGPDAGRRG